jgi:[amino group carrier protein]-lysine/ornithine hydrolase
MMIAESDSSALLIRLVSIPSYSGEESQAATFLAQWMRDHGLEARVDEAGNAVGVRGNGRKELLLLGHIDTVGGWLDVLHKDGRVYGRGAVDAKGPLCAFAVAAAQARLGADWRVTVVGAVEEEAATSKGARHILAERIDSPPVACIIGEPSGWDRLTLGYKGRLLAHMQVNVPLSHTAGQQQPAAEWLVEIWNSVQQHAQAVNSGIADDQPFAEFARLAPSLHSICSSDDGVYGTGLLDIGWRLPLSITPAELQEQASEILENLKANGAQLDYQFTGAEKAFAGDKNTSLVRAFLGGIRQQGGKPRFVRKTGTSDMNVVGPVWGRPILAYGPGDSALDHTPHECIELDEFLKAIKVLTKVIENYTGEVHDRSEEMR